MATATEMDGQVKGRLGLLTELTVASETPPCSNSARPAGWVSL